MPLKHFLDLVLYIHIDTEHHNCFHFLAILPIILYKGKHKQMKICEIRTVSICIAESRSPILYFVFAIETYCAKE